ncbi:ribonuclease III [Fulvivirga sp. RKSG066]|uniref:ribonuclease III n=1 Tax=Fulvivirga aurantia TaxID=2529383 RepID=UPI0016270B81|nr:ribonuclease III [Fulvivirga aurantia]
MNRAVKRLFSLFSRKSEKDKRLITAIKNIVGSKPLNLSPYRLAVIHSSMAKKHKNGHKESNERLEYLGDAILGAVVADFLFKKYPYKDEGFLTSIRSRIVNRESLNVLGKKVGLNQLVEYDKTKRSKLSHKSLYGDTLEALVGAVYLDKGYRFCAKFIIEKLITPYFDISEVAKSDTNFKSKIIEYAQQKNKNVRFDIINVTNDKHHKEFTAQVFIDDKPLGKGHGHSKKKAEQNASQKSCELLKLD